MALSSDKSSMAVVNLDSGAGSLLIFDSSSGYTSDAKKCVPLGERQLQNDERCFRSRLVALCNDMLVSVVFSRRAIAGAVERISSTLAVAKWRSVKCPRIQCRRPLFPLLWHQRAGAAAGFWLAAKVSDFQKSKVVSWKSSLLKRHIRGDCPQAERIRAISVPDVTTRRKVCSGTENGLNKLEVQEKKIDRLRLMYANCTIVHGNLEITYLTTTDLDNTGLSTFNFFSSIEEVTGYVLIAHNSIHNFSLPRLRIIWGDKKFRPASGQSSAQFSLLVLSNAFEHLGLPELRAIHDGSIGVQLNRRMCHWKTVDYRQLLGNNYKSRVQLKDSHQDCNSPSDWACDLACTNCWGPEASECQEMYRNNCAPQCSSGMCYGEYNPQYCCHAECAAGCSGPSDRDCYGCRSMRNNGRCVDKCPAPELYDPITTQYVKNPDGKYAFNRECVTVCPPHMVIYKEGCVSRCPEGFFAEEGSNVCEPCQGVCPKTCIIEHHVSSFNIKDFIGCTKVDGFIEIRKDTFEYGALFLANDSFVRYDSMSEDQLEALSSVRQVTHYVLIQSERLKSLSFLRNLEKIEGRKLFESSYALYITHSLSMEYLGTVSLQSILNGDVYIASNYDLCYIHNIPWDKRIISPGHNSKVRSNRKADICELEGKTCDPSCDQSQGCWGPGPEMCFDCMHWRLGNSCVDECSVDGLYQAAPKQCAYCHSECTKCTGAGPRNCTECKHVSLDGECVSACPEYTHFESIVTHKCERCHKNCYGYGCTGPGNFVGPGGCNRCKYGVLDEESQTIIRCLSELSAEKPCSHYPELENYYWTVPLSQKIQMSVAHAVCIKCHPVCKRCYGFGADYAHYGCECLKYSLKESSNSTTCVLECPRNTFVATPLQDNGVGECVPCDPQCNSCTGPESTDCVECLHYKDFIAETDRFNCTSSCPDERPFVSPDHLCTDVDIVMEKHKKSQIVIGVVVAALLALCILLFVCLFFVRPKASLMAHFKEPNPKLEIVAEVTPNVARLLLIRDFELKRGGILGYGAFGTVYKGIWAPEKEKVKIPVAIKVLHEANASAQQETLEEARIMASMSHPHLVQLIGVCIGQQMMLVTPLMPLGNLLDYVQTNRTKIGSAALICWCTQIADGMSYLEEHRLVHRDLAARNVLVQKPYHVRITDFGLAKLLEYGESEVKIFEGKMPIKWLALECIKYRRYTHKSDIWAFGITLWELFTFGDKPYKDVPLHQIPQLLENGERLSQPRTATLDMYMIMIRCWMVDADARPSFKELREIFLKMGKDPGRYLVVEGDALLRLPAYTPQDQREMIRQLIDDPEVVDPEEYFSTAPTSSPPLSPTTLTKPLIEGTEARVSCCSQRHASAVSQRYASDPLKNMPGLNTGKFSDSPTLTTDIENYLIPDSQQTAQELTPCDDDGVFMAYGSSGGFPRCTDGHSYYNEFSKPSTGICLENLEYMQGSVAEQNYRNCVPKNLQVSDIVQNETVV
uniref:receptor protein-tyrosine kinase n=1 Tax=Trichuris muris TaxID=70415 RepID=A0A5S6QD49_TRIMR